MTMENSGHENKDGQPAGGQPTHSQVPNPSRRRFTRAGVGASAVLLTLTSRSVLAQTACASPSGFASANLSRAGQEAVRCDGLTADEWLLQDRRWPISQDTRFADIFGSSSLTFRTGAPRKFNDAFPSRNDKKEKDAPPGLAAGTSLDEATLHQALSGTETPGVVRSLIAAYLNFLDGRNTYPTDLQVIAIFKEWQATGFYTPSAGIKWSSADIISYIAGTQGRLSSTKLG